MSEPGILPNPIPFGKYYLLERINVGGMAEVYKAKAFGVEGFERLLAVKKILASIAEDESFINMFIDEAKIAGQLNHPNIAQIFDLGKVDDSYFIALEYIGGKDLKTIFERARRLGEKVSIPRICYVIMKVCEGLAHAHHKKDAEGRDLEIVHRDVSPQNVLISYEGEVKIIDFGIAKAQGKTSQTQVGILKGKFSYMSPEQVRGLHVDNRSDIFSLGIVIYELLTLERLFLGESDFDTLEKIRKVEMSPPSLYNPHIPKELEDIILKALAKSPEDRFQTSAEFAEALERFMRNQGYYFTNKDLAGYMKEAFSADIEFENKKLEYYKSLNLQPLEAAANGSNGAGSMPLGGDLSWGEEEMETQIFDREGEEELEVDEADIVYADDVGEEIETVEDGRWNERDDEPMTFDDDPLDKVLQGPSRAIRSTGPMPAAEPRRDSAFTVEGPAVQRKSSSGQSWLVILGIALAVVAIGFVAIWNLLVPHTAPITFQTQPESVQVWVDGELKHDGPTPYTIELEPGPTQFELKRDGYIPFKTSREIVAGKTYNLTQRLDPEGSRGGALLVKSDPPGATIKLNGEEVGDQTPHTIEDPGKGPWKLELSKEGYFSESRELDTVPSNGIAVRLRPEQIAIKITSSPDRSEYTIFDKEADEKIASGRTPDTVKELDATKVYRVEVRRRDYEKWSDVVEPGFDPEVRLDPELTRREEEDLGSRPIAATRPPEPDRTKIPNKPDKPDKKPDKEPEKEEPPKPKPSGTGKLSVASKPAARVYIDGQDTGRYTPLIDFKVKSGKHKINLINPDFGLNKTFYIEIEPGGSERIINK